MVRRIYVEKRPGLSPEAGGLLADLRDFLGIQGITGVRVLHRYDVERLEGEAFEKARRTVFSEPQVDIVWDEMVPAAGVGFSNPPMGPFQPTVLAVFTASA